MIEKNVVILRIETGNPSGVVRYIRKPPIKYPLSLYL